MATPSQIFAVETFVTGICFGTVQFQKTYHRNIGKCTAKTNILDPELYDCQSQKAAALIVRKKNISTVIVPVKSIVTNGRNVSHSDGMRAVSMIIRAFRRY